MTTGGMTRTAAQCQPIGMPSRLRRSFSELAASLKLGASVVAAGLLFALVSSGISARPAFAHASALSTEPATGATVATSPPRVLVRFNGPVQFTVGALRVVDQNGETVKGVGAPAHPDGQADAVTSTVPALPDGPYIVAFQVLSADGHGVRGAFSFSVGNGSAAPPGDLLDKLANGGDTGNAAVKTTATVGRFVVFAGMIASLGVLVFMVGLWRAGASHRFLGPLPVVAAAFASIASLAQVGLVGALAVGRGLGAVFDAEGWKTVLRGSVGVWWLLRTAGLLAIAVLAVLRRHLGRRWWHVALGCAGTVVLVSMAKSGHGTSGRWPLAAVLSTTLHLAAIAFWIGGLIALLAAYGAGVGPALAARFSNRALAAVGVIVLSGLVQTKRQMLAFADFRSTDYGRSLTSKLLVFAVLIAIAALTRSLTKRPDRKTPLRPRDAIGMEVLFAAGILALTATLVNQPPPQAQAPKPFSESVFTGRREAQVIIEPATAGSNSVHLTILDGNALAAGPGAKNPTAMTLRFSFANANKAKSIPPIKVEPTQFLANHATYDNVVLPLKGTWTLDIVATYGSEQVLFTMPVKVG
jgi:copper transport protein